ncbi:Subtilisin-like protease 10 [Hondaea fermentalgiana]|uniref:subtilisin n=1 Tax=Hondaea fermentalgiana TaxID=2315210 RepID=A0A2R5GPJ0_9STRA|nr:Subtilisin-like protease 10 [Hondaea fermentalgiana]|eukprot:GBG32787.1 Subtilisin-like protease 10 [Hondaea fermentalgiana]
MDDFPLPPAGCGYGAALAAVERYRENAAPNTFRAAGTSVNHVYEMLLQEPAPDDADGIAMRRSFVPVAGDHCERGAALLALASELLATQRSSLMQVMLTRWIDSFDTKDVSQRVSKLKNLLVQSSKQLCDRDKIWLPVALEEAFKDNTVSSAIRRKLVQISGRSASSGEPARNQTVMMNTAELTALCESLDERYRAAESAQERRSLAFLRVFTVLQATIGCRPGDFVGAELADLATVVVSDDEQTVEGGVYISANVVHSKGRFNERFKNGHAWLFADLSCPARCPLIAVALALAEVDPSLSLDASSGFMNTVYRSWRGRDLYVPGRQNSLSSLWKSAVRDVPALSEWFVTYSSWNSLRKFVQTTVGGYALNCQMQVFVNLRAGHAEAKALAGAKQSNVHYIGNSPSSMRCVGLLCAHRHPLGPAGFPALELLLDVRPKLTQSLVRQNFPSNVRGALGDEALMPLAAALALAELDRGRVLRSELPGLLAFARRRHPMGRFDLPYATNLDLGLVLPHRYSRKLRTIVQAARVQVLRTEEPLLGALDAAAGDIEEDEVEEEVEAESDFASDAHASPDAEEIPDHRQLPPEQPATNWADFLGLSEGATATEEDALLDALREKLNLRSAEHKHLNLEQRVELARKQWYGEPGLGGVQAFVNWPEGPLTNARNHKRALNVAKKQGIEIADDGYNTKHFAVIATYENRRDVATVVDHFGSAKSALEITKATTIDGLTKTGKLLMRQDKENNQLVVRSERCTCAKIERLVARFEAQERALGLQSASSGRSPRRADLVRACYTVVEASVYVEERLALHPCVTSVLRDEVVSSEGYLTLPTMMQTFADQASGPGTFDPSYDGTGVTIYVFDSGIEGRHEEFAGRLGPGFSAIGYSGNAISNPDFPPYEDTNSHGTCVAGTAAGAAYGLARNATLVSVRVLVGPSGVTSDIIGGLAWVMEQQRKRPHPAIINLSISSRGSTLDQPFLDVSASGIGVVIAAGNSAEEAANFSPQRLGGNGLACGPLVVGALAPWSSFAMAGYSNFGAQVDALASGTVVCARQNTTDGFYVGKTGTSYAAPMVSAMLAMFMQRNEMNVCAATVDLLAEARHGVCEIPEDHFGTPNVLPQMPQPLPTLRPTAQPVACRQSPVALADEVQITLSGAYEVHLGRWVGAANADPRRERNWDCRVTLKRPRARAKSKLRGRSWVPNKATKLGPRGGPVRWTVRLNDGLEVLLGDRLVASSSCSLESLDVMQSVADEFAVNVHEVFATAEEAGCVLLQDEDRGLCLGMADGLLRAEDCHNGTDYEKGFRFWRVEPSDETLRLANFRFDASYLQYDTHLSLTVGTVGFEFLRNSRALLLREGSIVFAASSGRLDADADLTLLDIGSKAASLDLIKQLHPDYGFYALPTNYTASPTVSPTSAPTDSPTRFPSKAPTGAPSLAPTPLPTSAPTQAPSAQSEDTTGIIIAAVAAAIVVAALFAHYWPTHL